MKCSSVLVIFVLITVFSINIYAEDSLIVASKLEYNIKYLKEASKAFDFDYRILMAVIYAERRLNYDWEDEYLDNLIAEAGYNSTIGFCQVKMKTAYWIERQLSDTGSRYFPARKYSGILKISKSKSEIIKKLNNDRTNIFYAAAYIKIILSLWYKSGCSINNRPDIVGTLYSAGIFNPAGEERPPNKNPKSNYFGQVVKEFYIKMKDKF